MIPKEWDSDSPCWGATDAREHRGHKTKRDCYFSTWAPPPLPWVQRTTLEVVPKRPRRGWRTSPLGRSWHLAIGIRHDDGEVQVYCNVGGGPGPFRWREKPTLNWREEPGEWFCRRCVAEWTKGVHRVTVKVEGITVSKKQLDALVAAVGGGPTRMITIRPTNVEDTAALLAEWEEEDQTDLTTAKRKLLVVGDGVVSLP